MLNDGHLVFGDYCEDLYDEAFFEGIAKIVRKGHFVGNDSCVYSRSLSSVLESRYGLANVATCGNGTDALKAALHSAGVSSGDEVLVTAVSWISTTLVIKDLGGIPVYCDIDENGLIDIPEMKSKLSKKTKAILVVHLYGNVVDIDHVRSITDLPIIEDCAQAFGSRYMDGEFVGTRGDYGCFSFFPTKNLGAMGDGGLVCARQASDALKAKRYLRLGQGEIKGLPLDIGINSRLDSLQAYILEWKLHHVDWESIRLYRHKIIQAYSKVGLQMIDYPETSFPHLAVAVCSEREATRDVLRNLGIQTMVHYDKALSDISSLNGRFSRECLRATEFTSKIISLPLNHKITANDISKLKLA